MQKSGTDQSYVNEIFGTETFQILMFKSKPQKQKKLFSWSVEDRLVDWQRGMQQEQACEASRAVIRAQASISALQ
jgi:hypothetical protein